MDDLLVVEEQLEADTKSLDSCQYAHSVFQEILAKVQKAVDDLSLRQYSNLNIWVQRLDQQVGHQPLQLTAINCNCYSLCLPPSVMGEIYCFPRYQPIFSFGRRVIYHTKGLWEYIPKLIQSVCTTIFKRMALLCFYVKSFMLYINGFVSMSSTIHFKLFFKILSENQ